MAGKKRGKLLSLFSFNPQPKARMRLVSAGIGTICFLAFGCGLNNAAAGSSPTVRVMMLGDVMKKGDAH
ncbi:MAG: hypothetical protein ACYC6N_05350 [Pirellulaceae bacterium]